METAAGRQRRGVPCLALTRVVGKTKLKNKTFDFCLGSLGECKLAGTSTVASHPKGGLHQQLDFLLCIC